MLAWSLFTFTPFSHPVSSGVRTSSSELSDCQADEQVRLFMQEEAALSQGYKHQVWPLDPQCLISELKLYRA